MYSFRIDEIAYRLISNPWFDRVICLTIIVNCVFLALNDPTKTSNAQVSENDFMLTNIFRVSAIVCSLHVLFPA